MRATIQPMVALATALVLLLALALPAGAADLGNPPSNGYYAFCRANVGATTTNGQNPTHFYISCQYGPTTATVTQFGAFDLNATTGNFSSHTVEPISGTTCTSTSTVTCSVGKNSGGQFRLHYSWDTTAWSKTFAGGTSSTCTVRLSDASSTNRSCSLTWLTPGVSSYPTYPPDWFSGGSDANAAPTACFTTSPGSPGAGDATTSDAACSAGGPTTWSWRIGAATSTVLATTSTFGHTFGTPGTYTIRLTVGNDNGTASSSQLLTVGEAGSCTGTDCPGDTSTDSTDCGAWWHMFCHIVAALRWVFIPATDVLSSQWNALYTATTGHWPLGPVVWSFQTLGDVTSSFTNAANAGSNTCQTPNDTYGPNITINTGGGTSQSFHVPMLPNCPDNETNAGVVQVRQTVYVATSIFMILGFLLFLLRLVGIRVGGGGDEE